MNAGICASSLALARGRPLDSLLRRQRGAGTSAVQVFLSLVGESGRCGVCEPGEAAWVEGFVGVALAGEHEAGSAFALVEAVVDQFAAEGGGDRDAPVPGAAFRRDEAGVAVPVSGDVDEVVCEVDVVPVERLEFAGSEAGVEGGGVDRAVVRVERVEERADLCRCGDSVTASADSGEGEVEGRVDGDLSAAVCAPEDRARGRMVLRTLLAESPAALSWSAKSCSMVWLIAVSRFSPRWGRVRWLSACR